MQEHALRSHPGSRFPDSPYNGVTLACTRDQEAVGSTLHNVRSVIYGVTI